MREGAWEEASEWVVVGTQMPSVGRAPGGHGAHPFALSHPAQTPLPFACAVHPTSDGELTTCQENPFL